MQEFSVHIIAPSDPPLQLCIVIAAIDGIYSSYKKKGCKVNRIDANEYPSTPRPILKRPELIFIKHRDFYLSLNERIDFIIGEGIHIAGSGYVADHLITEEDSSKPNILTFTKVSVVKVDTIFGGINMLHK